MQFPLDAAPVLQKDPRLRKEVIRTLLQFSDVILIGGYGKTNLISHPINVYPGTTPIKMKHRPLNPVMEESLRQQIDRWLEQRMVEEADSPWSFPLVPVPKKNSGEVRWASTGDSTPSRRRMPSRFPTSPTICPAFLVAASSLLLMELGLSTLFLSDEPIGRKPRSLPRLGSTSLFGCLLAWPMPLQLTPDLSPRCCAIYHPQRSFATWTTRLSTPRMPGATYVSSAKSWQLSALQVYRSPRGRPSCSGITSSISGTKSALAISVFPRTTPLS